MSAFNNKAIRHNVFDDGVDITVNPSRTPITDYNTQGPVHITRKLFAGKPYEWKLHSTVDVIKGELQGTLETAQKIKLDEDATLPWEEDVDCKLFSTDTDKNGFLLNWIERRTGIRRGTDGVLVGLDEDERDPQIFVGEVVNVAGRETKQRLQTAYLNKFVDIDLQMAMMDEEKTFRANLYKWIVGERPDQEYSKCWWVPLKSDKEWNTKKKLNLHMSQPGLTKGAIAKLDGLAARGKYFLDSLYRKMPQTEEEAYLWYKYIVLKEGRLNLDHVFEDQHNHKYWSTLMKSDQYKAWSDHNMSGQKTDRYFQENPPDKDDSPQPNIEDSRRMDPDNNNNTIPADDQVRLKQLQVDADAKLRSALKSNQQLLGEQRELRAYLADSKGALEAKQLALDISNNQLGELNLQYKASQDLVKSLTSDLDKTRKGIFRLGQKITDQESLIKQLEDAANNKQPMDIDPDNTALDDARKTLDDMKSRLSQKEAEAQKHKDDLIKHRTDIDRIQKDLADRTNQLSLANASVEDYKSKVEHMKNQYDTVQKILDQTKSQKDAAEKEIIRLGDSIQKLNNDHKKILQTYKAGSDKLIKEIQASHKLNISKYQQAITDKEAAYGRLDGELTNLKNTYHQASQEITKLKLQLQTQSIQLTEKEGEIHALRQENTNTKVLLNQERENILAEKHHVARLQQDISSYKGTLQQYQQAEQNWLKASGESNLVMNSFIQEQNRLNSLIVQQQDDQNVLSFKLAAEQQTADRIRKERAEAEEKAKNANDTANAYREKELQTREQAATAVNSLAESLMTLQQQQRTTKEEADMYKQRAEGVERYAIQQHRELEEAWNTVGAQNKEVKEWSDSAFKARAMLFNAIPSVRDTLEEMNTNTVRQTQSFELLTNLYSGMLTVNSDPNSQGYGNRYHDNAVQEFGDLLPQLQHAMEERNKKIMKYYKSFKQISSDDMINISTQLTDGNVESKEDMFKIMQKVGVSNEVVFDIWQSYEDISLQNEMTGVGSAKYFSPLKVWHAKWANSLTAEGSSLKNPFREAQHSKYAQDQVLEMYGLFNS